MTLRISAAFDSGNIRVVGETADGFDLEIVRDDQSDFYQWFHFRLTGAKGRLVRLRIVNAGGSAYPDGWPGYKVCHSLDRETWLREPGTRYADSVLTIETTPPTDSIWFAYFAPYSAERHHDVIGMYSLFEGVAYESLGHTLDGRDIDYLRIDGGPKQVWLFARQHPGETMAEWWMEGALDLLTDGDSAVARALRQRATFHLVPNMNPDGSARGHLRTNAAGVNLNREWHAPTPERSPEVLAVRNRMDATGVDFAIDAHGDEAIPYVFLAGFEGIPSWTEAQGRAYTDFRAALARRSPDFQIKHGYVTAGAGKANLAMSTNQLAERFGCVAMTLEMPFKDNRDLPDPVHGWSPARSAKLAEECLGALLEVIDALPVTRRP